MKDSGIYSNNLFVIKQNINNKNLLQNYFYHLEMIMISNGISEIFYGW